jgi:hypothetical protein
MLGACLSLIITTTRGMVCHLQFMLGIVSVGILRSEYHGTHDHILLPQIPGYPNLEGQVSVLISAMNVYRVLPSDTWFPFRRLLRFTGLRWKYSNKIPRWTDSTKSLYIAPALININRPLHYYVFSRALGNNVFTQLFPNNGCFAVASSHSCYLAMGLHSQYQK